ncbi:type I polyketide synthase [Nocardia sp. XZ_19_385]|uniref:type I polyketide synthase n=1 Tax=Nocardia sp. XZ_19_385 TaxID=2769488 RepID=UPI00188F289A|nr:type I polyketide synthase [Nocardia sp. XZ_19_385]
MIDVTTSQIDDMDAVAVVGMSCRFAGGIETPEQLWKMLVEGGHAVSELPDDRWESEDPAADAIWQRTTRLASYLDDVKGFDAAFFGISPREAVMVDPQQRIVLELAWEALEHAGIPPFRWGGTDAGVFVASTCHDYSERLRADLPNLEAWAVNGANSFGISNRISYALDLRGPSMTVDTACAGSLTAIHLACQHLWRGEIPAAIVGGVNVIAAPGSTVALEGTGATARDGRCKTFDSAADGYGRGEGAALVVLKRYVDARRDGDHVLALIRGTGTFHDGAGQGFMVPNGEAQEQMLRKVYARWGIDAKSIDYVEAHGTGTPVGDPIEVQALSRFFGVDRTAENPCLIGSVKPNIGHLEAGAGVAGLIKTVLALVHGQIPPSVYSELTPAVNWADSGLRVVSALTAWPKGSRPRRAGVSGFGVGGAIAHLIVEQAPDMTSMPHTVDRGGPKVFVLSARSESAVRANAARLADWLDEHRDTRLSAVASTLALRRSHVEVRSAITASEIEKLGTALRDLAQGKGVGVECTRILPTDRRDPVWVFSGQGAQWQGMGRHLLAEEPVFASMIDRLVPIFEQECGFSPRDAIATGDWSSPERTLSMVFAMQMALAQVWADRGLRAGAVVGHSTGEIAAAVVAGVLDLESAARFNCRRAVALSSAAGTGAMAMVNLPFAQLHGQTPTGVEAAVSASTTWTVVSGATANLDQAIQQWSAEGLAVRRVDTSIAFHSALLDPFVRKVAAAAADCLDPQAAKIPLYSTVTPDARSNSPRDGTYWGKAVREPVRFLEAIQAAAEDGHRMFVEVSTHPIVAHSISEILEEFGHHQTTVAHSLRRGQPETKTLLSNLAQLHCQGAAVDWSRSYATDTWVDLPTMAWQHHPYWIEPTAKHSVRPAVHDASSHILLGARHHIAGSPSLRVWETTADFDSRPYPGHHQVLGVEILPAAVLLTTFLAAAAGTHPTAWPLRLDTVEFHVPLMLDTPQQVQVVLHTARLSMTSRTSSDEQTSTGLEEHTTHATAAVVRAQATASVARADLAAIRQRCGRIMRWEDAEETFARNGVASYGLEWHTEDPQVGESEFLAVISSSGQGGPLTQWAPLLDAALTLVQILAPHDAQQRVLSTIGGITLNGEPNQRLLVHGLEHPDGTVDLQMLTEDGTVRAVLLHLQLKPVGGTPNTPAHPHDLVHQLAWRPRPHPATPQIPGSVVLIGDDHRALSQLLEFYRGKGINCVLADGPDNAMSACADAVVVLPSVEGPMEDTAEKSTWALVRTAQRMASSGSARPHSLWCVTRGVRAGVNAPGGALWGAARIIAGEYPEFWGGLVDLDPDLPLHCVADVVGYQSNEDVVALTADGELVPRLQHIETAPVRPEFECHAGSSYLITGGLGALGLKTAQWLAERGARRMVLTSRHGLPPRQTWNSIDHLETARRIAEVRALETAGVSVHVVALDITDLDSTKTSLAALDLPPIRGIVHAAGASDGTLLQDIAEQTLARVMRPKVRGIVVLDRIFPPGTVDFFVSFSSCGQLARVTGQTGYAAANAFLDAFAARRRAVGCKGALSLAMTTVLNTGMSVGNTAAMEEAHARGMGALSTADVFGSWQFAARYPDPYFVVTPLLPAEHATVPIPVLSELAARDTEEPDDSRDSWKSLSEGERAQAIESDLREQISAELHMPPADLDVDRPLSDYGMDSVLTVRLRTRINRSFHIDLPPTVFWNKPTLETIASIVTAAMASATVETGNG